MGSFNAVELADLELTGPRLLLRRWRPADAQAVHDAMLDGSIGRFLALPTPYSLDDAREFVTRIGHEGRDEGIGLGCAMIERQSGRVVGAIALRMHRAGGIGYWTVPDARGQGYSAEATRVLSDWAFATGVARVHLRCDTRNLASVRVALSAGFGFEGIERGLLPAADDPTSSATHRDIACFGLLSTDSRDAIAPAFPPLPKNGLDDGVLLLRVAQADHAVALAEIEDELSVSWNFDGAGLGVPQAQRIATDAGLRWLIGPNAKFVMVERASDRVAGELLLRTAGPPQVCGIGYGVHPAFRGRGYTARALRLLVPWAFESADVARLELGAKPANIASHRAALAAGFQPDGVRRGRLRNADGTFSDEVRFVLLNPRYV